MARIARAVLAKEPHHITQRGIDWQDVFFSDADRIFYMEVLRDQCKRFEVKLLGYCLLNSHIHLLAIPRQSDALSKAVGRTHYYYARYVNKTHKKYGQIWQDRFASCVVDEYYKWIVLKYIERHPVRWSMVQNAWDYPWSSAMSHISGIESDTVKGLLHLDDWVKTVSLQHWRKTLAAGDSTEEIDRIRMATHRGRPLGSEAFILSVEQTLNRTLRPASLIKPNEKPEPDDEE